MAGVQERGGSYRIYFRYQGKQVTFPLGKVTKQEADAKAAQAEYLLMRLKQRLIELPPGVRIADFLQHDGKAPVGSVPATKPTKLGDLRDRFLSSHAGAHEKNTLYTARIHFGHLVATLGRNFDLRMLELANLQGHIDRRCPKVSPATAGKEIATFRTAWNWGVRMKLVSGLCPVKGLVYPKTDEKPPFQTRAEIKRQLDGLTEAKRDELWESLYLTLPEIAAFLADVRESAGHPWIYPMVATAAHAGLRRSELVRALKSDVDFEGMILTVRERKRAKGKRTTRRVPLSTVLAAILREWMEGHPGGPFLFAQPEEVFRSKKRSRTTGHRNGAGRPTSVKGRLASVKNRERPGILPLTVDEATKHFRRAIDAGRWSVIPGLHCLRHSFVSACASKGVDLRMLQEWCGHMSPEMQRRYMHLYPSVQAEALRSVFG